MYILIKHFLFPPTLCLLSLLINYLAFDFVSRVLYTMLKITRQFMVYGGLLYGNNLCRLTQTQDF